ncbi:MFS transporter [Salmonella enterica]|nr:MFS transporter [Salmonella enterica]
MLKNNKILLYLLSISTLQFFIQGIWSMTLGLVLNNNGMGNSIRIVFFFLGLATIISPMLVGYISDRFSSPKFILSLLHFFNAISMSGVYLSFINHNSLLIIVFIFVTGLLFYPTTALVNSLTFQNVSSDSLFPIIRSFGTIGFMISGFFMGFYNIESNCVLFLFASMFSVVISIIAFRAPFKQNELQVMEASSITKSLKAIFSLIKEKKAMPYFTCALFMMVSQLSYTAYMPVYLDQTGFSNPSILMQVAVVSELIFMLILPMLIKNVKIETLMLLGTSTYALRSLITLTLHDTNYFLILISLFLQGFSWVMFFIVFDIYIKKISLEHNLHQMQSLKVILINGFGVSVASLICGYAFNNLKDIMDGSGWFLFWMLPLFISVSSFLIILFNRKNIVQ